MKNISDLSNEEREILFLQRTIGREFGIQSIIDEVECDYKTIISLDRRHLEHNSVLDIGGGFGLMLSQFRDDYKNLFLLDKDEFNKNKSLNGLNNVKDFGGYNKFSVAEKVIGKKVNFLTTENYTDCNEMFDLIYSWYCCGWHFDPNVYLEWCLDHLNVHGTICFLLKKHQPFIDSFYDIALKYKVVCDVKVFDGYKDTKHSSHKTSYIGVLKKYK